MPFTASFTGGTGQALQDFDATNWARVAGTASYNLVTQNNRLERPYSGTMFEIAEAMYRRIGGPTGDSRVQMSLTPGAGISKAAVALRVQSGADTAYLFRISQELGRQIIRRVAGSDTVLGTASGGIDSSTAYTVEGRAVNDGDGHVHLEMFVGGTSVLTFEDDTGSRIESGEPGVRMEHSGATGDLVHGDDYEDQSLAAPPEPPVRIYADAVISLGGHSVIAGGSTVEADILAALNDLDGGDPELTTGVQTGTNPSNADLILQYTVPHTPDGVGVEFVAYGGKDDAEAGQLDQTVTLLDSVGDPIADHSVTATDVGVGPVEIVLPITAQLEPGTYRTLLRSNAP